MLIFKIEIFIHLKQKSKRKLNRVIFISNQIPCGAGDRYIEREREKKVRFSHFKLEKKSWPCEGMSKKFEGKKSRKVCSG